MSEVLDQILVSGNLKWFIYNLLFLYTDEWTGDVQYCSRIKRFLFGGTLMN